MRNEIPRLKRMYVEGRVSLEVFEAMMDYYLDEQGGTGPTILGHAIPSSVDPDAPPADPAKHPEVEKRLE